MMHVEASTQIQATPAQIFAIYAKVDQWPQWDPDAKSASIEGPFVTGARGEIVPNGGPKSALLFEQVLKDRGFTVSCKLPLCTMRFVHELKADGDVTHVTHRAEFEGLLSPLFGRLIGSGMRKSLPKALAGLKAAAEAK
jgi:hypothetical protein